MKKILMSLMAIALVVGLVGAGTIAFFSDSETSTGNIMQAGTLDLELKVGEVVNGSFSLVGIKPCQDLAPITLRFTNLGDVEGWVNLNLSFGEADNAVDADSTFEFYAGPNAMPGDLTNLAMEMSADEFAKLVYVKALTQDDSVVPGGPWNILPDLVLAADTNGDGLLSLYELKVMLNATTPPDCIFTLTKKTITIVLTLRLGDAFETSAGSGAAYTGGMDGYTGGYTIYQGTPVIWNVPQADGINMTITAKLDQRVP